jgi:hypothetical protein
MRKSERKIFLFGRYSLALLLPKRWLNELGVKAGTVARLELDRARKRIVVRLGDENPPAPTRPKKSKLSEQGSEDEFEPIPQL